MCNLFFCHKSGTNALSRTGEVGIFCYYGLYLGSQSSVAILEVLLSMILQFGIAKILHSMIFYPRLKWMISIWLLSKAKE